MSAANPASVLPEAANTAPNATHDAPPQLHWTENDQARSALWRSERGVKPPKRVEIVDDTTTADTAYRWACEGVGLLWRGDFQNARQMLLALARRVEKPPKVKRVKASAPVVPLDKADAFNRHRQAQGQRARVLGMVLVELDAFYGITLRRGPDVATACTQAWGPSAAKIAAASGESADATALALATQVVSLRELTGVMGAAEWRKKGVEIAALGEAPNNRVHPHYGVFSPVRGEYIGLVAQAPLPQALSVPGALAFDIGTGTGVLAAVLAKRGVQVVATDNDARAQHCAIANIARLGLAAQVRITRADLFPEGLAALVVCNPPWVPARASSSLERAVYDEGGSMLRGFVAGLRASLSPGGEGWLILSDLAEHLGLRTRAELLASFEAAGLVVLGRTQVKASHGKATDASDALHAARAAEVTSLWRLAAAA